MFILQACKETKDIGALQKAADFVKAFTLGFEVEVCIIFVEMVHLETLMDILLFTSLLLSSDSF